MRRSENRVNAALAEYLAQVAEKLNTDELVAIAKRYEIPNAVSALNASGELRTIFSRDIVIGDIIDASELNEAMKKAQVEMVGSITAVIIFIVVGALLFSGIGIILENHYRARRYHRGGRGCTGVR